MFTFWFDWLVFGNCRGCYMPTSCPTKRGGLPGLPHVYRVFWVSGRSIYRLGGRFTWLATRTKLSQAPPPTPQRGCARHLSGSSNVQWPSMAQLGRRLMSVAQKNPGCAEHWAGGRTGETTGLTYLWIVLKCIPVIVLELVNFKTFQNDKQSAPKARIPCKAHGLLPFACGSRGKPPGCPNVLLRKFVLFSDVS